MSAYLRRFASDEVILSGQDAHDVLRFFFLEPGVSPGALTVEDRAFAQALLVNAIDQSYDMGFIEALFRSVFGKTPASLTAVAGVLANFTRRAVANWFTYATADDLKDPKIYESVRLVVQRNFATVWRVRLNTGQLTY